MSEVKQFADSIVIKTNHSDSMNEKEKVMKDLIFMLSNRMETVEKKIDALEEEQRATSKKQFDESISFFKETLNELDELI
ncbi:hypothetical protein [Alkalibacillus almallahensis]|uniref:hypothetical protein n=1 Tax=Alkalibacillus almallahensis TaxID=1379154 RepID=UPI0014224EB3|nr:hypothetical protein [Alkalibacillus almallahensis]NIK10932.1 prefoldin subunit 5 [Alkalibacillus almallahensis]